MTIPFPERLIQSWLHKLLRNVALRASLVHATEFAFAAIAGVGSIGLTSISTPGVRRTGLILVVMLAIVAVARFALTFRETRSSERLRANVVCCLLRLMHEKVFWNSNHVRLTLFIQDPVAKVRIQQRNQRKRAETFLIPYQRREAGKTDYSCWDSRIYYPVSSDAVTAKGWRMATRAKADFKAGDLGAYVLELPPFNSRLEMEDYYQRTLGISATITRRLSDYMIEVVQVLSFPLVNDDGDPIALLSVDSTVNFSNDDGPVGEGVPEPIEIDSVLLQNYLEGARQILLHLPLNAPQGGSR